MSGRASEKELSDLHGLLAKVFASSIVDPDRWSPSLMNAARQFLKDNGMESAPTNKGPMADLAKTIGEMTYDDDGHPIFN